MRITVALLKRLGACHRAVRRFKRMFPHGCALSERNYKTWAKRMLFPLDDLGWLIVQFVDHEQIDRWRDKWCKNYYNKGWDSNWSIHLLCKFNKWCKRHKKRKQ